jgi:hypothetical protein
VTGNTLTLKANRVRYTPFITSMTGRDVWHFAVVSGSNEKLSGHRGRLTDRAAGQTCRRERKMTSNTLNAVPATVLETMAERLNGQPEPLKIRSNDDHAALAADVLWKFARKTGLNRKAKACKLSSRIFWPICCTCANSAIRRGWHRGFNALLNMAMMHYEQENGGDSEEPI